MQEMSRVLKPGGRIVIATWCEREATHPRCGREGRAASAGGLDASWLTCESRRRRPSAPRSARPSTTCTASGRTRTSSRLRSTAASWRGPARLDEMLREDPRGPGRVRPQHGEDRQPAAPALAPARLGRVATTRPRRLRRRARPGRHRRLGEADHPRVARRPCPRSVTRLREGVPRASRRHSIWAGVWDPWPVFRRPRLWYKVPRSRGVDSRDPSPRTPPGPCVAPGAPRLVVPRGHAPRLHQRADAVRHDDRHQEGGRVSCASDASAASLGRQRGKEPATQTLPSEYVGARGIAPSPCAPARRGVLGPRRADI